MSPGNLVAWVKTLVRDELRNVMGLVESLFLNPSTRTRDNDAVQVTIPSSVGY
jgi:hypothetical protein